MPCIIFTYDHKISPMSITSGKSEIPDCGYPAHDDRKTVLQVSGGAPAAYRPSGLQILDQATLFMFSYRYSLFVVSLVEGTGWAGAGLYRRRSVRPGRRRCFGSVGRAPAA